MSDNMNKISDLGVFFPVCSVALSIPFLFASLSHAAPSGANVVSGDVNISQSSSLTTINQHTDTAIIDWQQFGIQHGETVEFVQLNSNSVALNRVIGRDKSIIDGSLKANGKVFLINRHGILLGKNSQVSVGGLVATTSDISNANFLNRLYKFNKPSSVKSASVINHGNINIKDAGLAILVAPSVENHGKIVARLGKVILGSANSFNLDLYGDELISFDVTNQVQNGHVSNTGKISANGGQILISAQGARNAVDSVINLGGLVEAQAIGSHKGQVILAGSQQGIVNITGKIDVNGKNSGEKGGSVHITGEKIGLMNTAMVDARGYSGGGEIRIGKTSVKTIINKPKKSNGNVPEDPFYAAAQAVLNGDYENEVAIKPAKTSQVTQLTEFESNTSLDVDINSDFFYMAKQALLDASASETGNGGEVIIHTTEASRVYGEINAKGGTKNGDGGFIETSANRFLDITNTPDVGASKGQGGEWLLDPNNINIVAASAVTNDSIPDGLFNAIGTPNFTSTGDGSQISVDLITNALNSGNVVIETASTGLQLGNITLSTDLDYTGAKSNSYLTLKAHNNIVLSKNISSTNSLNLKLIADKDSTNVGDVFVNADVNLNGGDFEASGLRYSQSTGGQITAKDVTIKNKGAIVLGAIAATNLTVTQAGGAVTDTGVLAISDETNITTTMNQNITLDNANNDFDLISVNGGIVRLRDQNDIILGVNDATDLVLSTGGKITQSGRQYITGLLDVNANGNNVELDNPNNNLNIVKVKGNKVSLRDSDTNNDGLILGESNVIDLSLIADGEVTQNVKQTISGTVDINAGNNNVTLDNINNDFNKVSITGATVNISDKNNIILGENNVTELSLATSGTVTQSAVQTVTGLADINAGSNHVTLGHAANNFGSVSVTGGTVIIRDSDSINLAENNITNFTLTTGGSITQSGSQKVSETTIINAAGNDVALSNNTDNDFGKVQVTGNVVSLSDKNDIVLGLNNVTDLNLKVNGDVTQNSRQTVTGSLSIAALDMNTEVRNVILENPNNDFGTVSIVGGSDSAISLKDSNDIILGAINSKSLSVNTKGAISDSGAVVVDGDGNFTAINPSGVKQNIILDEAANNFNTLMVNGATVIVNDIDDVEIGNSETSHLTVTAGADILLGSTKTKNNGSINIEAGDDLILTGDSYSADGSGDIQFVAKNNNISNQDHNGIIIQESNTTLRSDAGNISLNKDLTDPTQVTIVNDATFSVLDLSKLMLGAVGSNKAVYGNDPLNKDMLNLQVSDGNLDIAALGMISDIVDPATIKLNTTIKDLYINNNIQWTDAARDLELIGTDSVTIADDIKIISTQKSIVVDAQNGNLSLGDNTNEDLGTPPDDKIILIQTESAGTNITLKASGGILQSDSVDVVSAGEIQITANESIELNGNISTQNGAIAINSQLGNVTLQDVEVAGIGAIQIAANDSIVLNGNVSTQGGHITFGSGSNNGKVIIPSRFLPGTDELETVTISSQGGDIDFDSIGGIDNSLAANPLHLNASSGPDISDNNGEITGEVDLSGRLSLAGKSGVLTGDGNLGNFNIGATPKEIAGSIGFIPGYLFGDFTYNGFDADLSFNPDAVRVVIRGVAPLTTVLNDKLFSAGISEGKLDEKMTASDAKVINSYECESDLKGIKQESQSQEWSLLGVKNTPKSNGC